MKRFVAIGTLLFGILNTLTGQEVPTIAATVSVPPDKVVAHDPVILEENGVYYLFTTGPGVSVWTSPDRELWTMREPVFAQSPAWTKEAVPAFNGHMWAPDISLRDGRYVLYYAVSSFGKNGSCIGAATNATLNPESPDFGWTDHGPVICSEPGVDDWNAIDPNLVFDESGQPYLAFGSFWSGLKMVALQDDLIALADASEEPIAIASRRTARAPSESGSAAQTAGNGAIEGPFIYRRDGFYYLFASVDYCCRGADSTYKMIFGRSENLLGPYVDKQGTALLDGGGTLLMEGDERWHGVGHNAVCLLDGQEYVVFHGYDSRTPRGVPKLRVEPLAWDDAGWPYIASSASSGE